jgi:hypothetical protein
LIGRAAQDGEYNVTLDDENPVNHGYDLVHPFSVKISGDLA